MNTTAKRKLAYITSLPNKEFNKDGKQKFKEFLDRGILRRNSKTAPGDQTTWFGIHSFNVSNKAIQFKPFAALTLQELTAGIKPERPAWLSIYNVLYNYEFPEETAIVQSTLMEITEEFLYNIVYMFDGEKMGEVNASRLLALLQNLTITRLEMQAIYRDKTQSVNIYLATDPTDIEGSQWLYGYTSNQIDGVVLMVGNWQKEQFYSTLYHEVFHKADLISSSLKQEFYGFNTEEYYAHLATELSMKMISQLKETYNFTVNKEIYEIAPGLSISLHKPVLTVKKG